MNFRILGRVAGVLALTAGLAGCMDVTMELDVQNETNARMTTTSTIGADFYALAKSGMAAAENTAEGAAGEAPASAEEGFCEEEGAQLTEHDDGSATCVVVKDATFAEISADENGPKFEVVSPGVVKVSFSTAEMKGEIGADDALDAETKAMMQTLFEGHAVTIRIKGKSIVETNMTKGADGSSAEIVIPFLDLINGTTTLPDELYATVKTN